MSKKTFKDNPAMRFITEPIEEKRSEETEAPSTSKIPAPPQGFRVNPLYIEKKTRRVQLIFQPSLYERGKEKAETMGLSFNEYMHQLLEEDLDGQED